MNRIQFGQKFCAFNFPTDQLSDVLKNEVGVVKGRRHGKYQWGCDNFAETEDLAGGDGSGMIANVIKMKCKPLTQKFPLGSNCHQIDLDRDQLKHEAEMMFKGFCAKNGINIILMEGSFRNHAAGQGGESHGESGGGTDKGQRGKKSVNFHASSERGESGSKSNDLSQGQGGAGGGRRPPRKPSRNRSSADSDSQTHDDLTSSDLESETSTSAIFTTPTSTSTSVVNHPGRDRRKRTIILSHDHDHDNSHLQVPSAKRSRKTIYTTASSEPSSDLHIHTFGATGKPEKKSFALNKSVIHERNPFPKGLPKIRKRRQTRRSSSIHSNSPLSFSKGAWKAGQLDSPEDSPEDKDKPSPQKQGKQRPSKVENLQVRGLTVTTNNDREINREIQIERDSEWLKWSSSELSFDEDEEEQDGVKKRRKTKIKLEVQQDLRLFLDSTRVLDTVNKILGLSPYKKVERGNHSIQVKWQPRSKEFLGICLNSCVFFMTTLGIFYSLIIIFTYDEGPQSSTHNIIKLDFANHFTEALFMLILTLFLTIWSVSCVMELGGHYAEFFSRFNLGVSYIKYDVTEGINGMIVKQLITVFLFLSALAGLFFGGRDEIEVVREMCGFIGFCLLRPFSFNLRESIYYPLAEVFGFVVFCYCFFCLNVVLLQFLVYGKALDNMAKRWNLRLAYALGDISERTSKGKAKSLKKTIPLKKLQAEHLIIVSLFRNLGHVNAVVFNGFAFCVSLEIVLVIFLLFAVFTEGTPPPTNLANKYVEGDILLPVPLRLHQLKVEEIFKALIPFTLTFLAFWLFSGVLHNAADNLHIGIEYVRRHGLLLCNSSKERRFILSMMNSYSPKRTYWIGQGFHFNREFLLGVLAFVIGVSMVTVEFSPERTALEQLTTCDPSGKCTLITIPRTVVHLAYEVAGIDPPDHEGRQAHLEAHETGSASSPDVELDEKYLHEFLFQTPFSSSGSFPHRDSDLATTCPGNWPTLKELRLPTIYKPVSYSGMNLYGQVKEPFGSDPTIVPTKCRTSGQTGYNFPYELTFGVAPSGPIVDCFGNELEISFMEFDDCGNLPFKTPNSLSSQPVDPVLRPVATSYLPGISKEKESIVCCYEYPGYSGSKEQVKVCNMPNAPVLEVACHLGKDRERMEKWDHIWKHHSRILTRIQFEKEEKGNVNFIKDNEAAIKECLCRLKDPQVDLSSKEHCICTGMAILPCASPAYFKEAEEDDYSVKCGSIRVPILFKASSDNSLVFGSEHKRYQVDCKESAFHDPFFHTDDLTYANPCGSGPQLNLVDCAGARIVVGNENKDDCSNWRIPTPDTTSGEMLPPKVSIKAFNYNPNEKKIVSSPSAQKAFLCCFEYASQTFKGGDQNKYCNAPNLESLNKEGWCKKVVDSNGKRDPGSFVAKAAYEQLYKKLELTVEYQRREKKPDWLDDTTTNGKWSRCMCSNKIIGFEGTAGFEQARKNCIPLIVLPHEIHRRRHFDLLEPFPKCDHAWPNFPALKRIATPQVFIKENGIWEMPPRYQKTGDPSTTNICYVDESYEEIYSNDAASPLFNLNLMRLSVKNDDCGNFPFGGDKLKLRLVPEFSLHLYEKGGSTEFQNTDWIHCCYVYVYGGIDKEQRKVCNLPNPPSIKKKCRNSPMRVGMRRLHEKELARKLTIADDKKSANFIGNRVPPPGPVNWDSPGEKAWMKCICEGSSQPGHNENCVKLYLPPCIIPTGTINTNIVKLEETFSKCSSGWSTGPPTLRFPIIMEFRRKEMIEGQPFDVFIKINLFNDGSAKINCPTDKSVHDLSSTVEITDCYGDSLPSRVERDDCKNPNVATPVRTDLKVRQLPKLQLIPADMLPGGSDDRIFCCFNYPIAESDEQVRVCNMYSKIMLDRECKDRVSIETDLTLRQFIETLKKERKTDPTADVLKSTVPFTDPKRVKWTKCICNRDKGAC